LTTSVETLHGRAPDPAGPSAGGGIASAFVKSALAVVVGIGLAALAVRSTGVSMDALLEQLGRAKLGRVLLGVLGGFVLTATQAVRWRAVLRGIAPVRFWTVFQSKLVGYAANCVLPARLGDLVRIDFVASITGVSRAKILATGLTDLWFDKIGWVLAFAVAWFVAPMPEWVMKAMTIMGILILAVGGALLAASRMSFRVDPPPPGVASSVAMVEGARLLAGWKALLLRFREGLDQPKLGSLLLSMIWLAPLSWCWESLLIQFVGGAFGFELNFAQAFAVLTAFNLSMVVPIPGNAGAFEVAAVFALRAFGVQPDQALAFSLVYHLMLLIPGVIAGTTIFGLKGGKSGVLRTFKRMTGLEKGASA
jgi:uncharacterized protein (TIRG00374 family)